MALETLVGLHNVGGVKIEDVTGGKSVNEDTFCVIDTDENAISFKIQKGPVNEVGVNGCQVSDMITVAMHIIENLDRSCPCIENKNTLGYLQLALNWQEERTRSRMARNVEGTNNA
jgi:hypothetical protein